jgi:arylsulfatase A-like enzyme
MTAIDERRSAGARILHTAVVGLVNGACIGLVYFALEVLIVMGDAVPYLGAAPSVVLAVYAATGAAVGVAAGLAIGTVGLFLAYHPTAVTFAGLAFLYTALHVLRETTSSQLTHLAPAELTSVVALFFMWIGFAFLLGRVLRRREGRVRPAVVRAAAVIAVLAIGALALWAPLTQGRLPGREAASPGAPDVVVVLVDAMRADHLSAYGYARATSPTIDRLAAEGVLFANAYAHGNRTIVSTPALFTSMYPSMHGAVGFREIMVPLPESRRTFTELYRDAGYATLGMMSNIYLKTPFGLTRGFDRVEEFNVTRYRTSVYRLLAAAGLLRLPEYARAGTPSATEVTDAAIAWLGRVPEDRPAMFYMHYMDVHHPYTPPAAYDAMFRPGDAVDAIDAQALFTKTTWLVRGPPPIALTDDELTRLTDLYDACIRYTDAEIGRFLDALARRRANRERIVIITSDHGDEFMEHGTLYHTNIAHEELIRVPLVVWWSDGSRAGTRVEDLARHIDVLPTMAEWLETAAPPQAMGSSLTPLIAAEETPPRESVAEGDFCAALVYDGWKILRVDSSGVDHLYDLRADPGETDDLAGSEPERLEDMRRRLDAYFAMIEERGGEERRATSETLRQLRALGYVN